MVSTPVTVQCNTATCLAALPNELIGLMMQHLPAADLATVCRTSKFLKSISAPVLHRAVSLTTGSQLELFLESIQNCSENSIWYTAREFSLKKLREPDVEPASPRCAVELTDALCRMTQLKVLKLVTVVIDFTELFQRGHFEQLSRLECMVSTGVEDLLSLFLKRHQKLAFLSLDAPRGLELSGPIILPNLTHFYGSCSLLPAFDFRHLSLTMLRIMLKFVPVDGPESIDLTGIPNVTNVQVFDAIWPDERDLLGKIATHLPHVERLAFSRSSFFASRISLPATVDIETNLLKFDALRILNFGSTGGNQVDDRDTVLRWGAACQTLQWITLNQQRWYRRKKGWAISTQ
ncbi:hypothetical protein R3P38DRAFT_3004573 [Favolaschia claudopus]|uniref:F-box domain-containing protein n=1 Tax=Favolaschia claudopus TaxID=2862362 RepID=A0AAW0AMQ7_9AGAR